MRRLLPVICLLLCSAAHAQKHYRFAGYVQMANDPLVSYYLELTTDGNDAAGYSITGYKDGNRLKAAVKGRFSTPSDLYIEETSSLDGPRAPFKEYCYFSAHLKLTIMMSGQQRWNGPFISRQAGGEPCSTDAGGIMTITDNAPPLDPVVPKPVPKPLPLPKPVPRPLPKPPPVAKPAPRVVIDTPKPRPVPPPVKKKDTARPVTIIRSKPVAPPPAAPAPDSCQRVYDWSSDSLSLDIWDGWTIDGDVVSLHIGGRTLLNHTKLSEAKQHFSIPLNHGLNVLFVALHEEGFEPPNTPNLTLYDGAKRYELSISGNEGEVARICIHRR